LKIKILSVCTIIILLSAVPIYAEEWKEHKGRHFVIYYQSAPIDFVEEVEKTAEQYYEEITRDLGFTRYKGWTWDERAQIYIYDDSQSYVEEGRQAQWSHGSAQTKTKVIRTFPTAHGFFDSTLPHELGHIIFREFVGFKAEIPLWFEEGIAMYQEKAKRFGAHNAVIDARNNGYFIPLKELSITQLTRNTDQKIVTLFYAESASVVYYMINELGKYRFVQFCRKLSEGGPFEWALKSVYVRFKNYDDLNKAWLRYLDK